MIEVKNITKQFIKQDKNKKKQKFFALDDISFEANPYEILGILGANGAGKTTLLRIIAGILEPTQGKVIIDGKTYKTDEIKIKKKIAFLSGNTKLYERLSPNELLTMCGRFYGMEDNQIQKSKKEVIELLNIGEFENTRIGNLSTGQTQRVSIARCLLHDPLYYILDEATTGLDIMSSQIILDFIKSEKEKGKTIIYSTHYMEEAQNICSRVLMINKGKVIEQGTPKQLKEKTNTSNLRDTFFKLIGGVDNNE